MNKIVLDKNAKIIIDMLKQHSFDAYIVGGCVRDMLLGIIPEDIDITTSALPKQTIEIFSKKYKIVKTGEKYGTITIIIDKKPIEVTTFRSEEHYIDGRRPSNVTFEKDIQNDLLRRDFTINSMAYNDCYGLIDLFGGINDLKNKIVKCVGNPLQRFEEDKLRMMRCIRFASVLDFSIEENTFNAIYTLAQKINSVSIERINVEFSKMLLSKMPSKAIILLYKTKLLKEILPVIHNMYGFDQKNPYHTKDLFFHTMDVLDNVDDNLSLKLSALFHDTGKLYTQTIDENNIAHYYSHQKVSTEIAKKELKRLKYSNDIIDTTCKLICAHMIDSKNITNKGIRRIISKIGIENINLLINLQQADSKSTTIGKDILFEKKVNELLEEKNVFSKKDLAINGNTLLNLGYKGRQIGLILDFLLDKVLENPNLNEEKILINLLKKELLL